MYQPRTDDIVVSQEGFSANAKNVVALAVVNPGKRIVVLNSVGKVVVIITSPLEALNEED